MNAVLGFIILVSLMAKCYSAPMMTEFDIEYQKIESMVKPSEQTCLSDCLNVTNSECQCACPTTNQANCTDYQCVEEGFKKLRFHCIPSNSTTHTTCRLLARLKGIVKNTTTMCAKAMTEKQFLEHIKMEWQKHNNK